MSQRQAKRARQAQRAGQPPARSRRRSDWKKIGLITAAGAVVAALIAAGLVLARGNQAAPVASSGSAGGAAVKLEGTDPRTGRHVSLASYAGKPVVINIWASWCPGCNQEASDLGRFARAHPEAQLLGIDIQDTKGGARGFYQRWGWHHPSVFDPSGSISASFGLQGLPTTLFLNRQHRIVSRIVGASNFAGFTEGLRQATT